MAIKCALTIKGVSLAEAYVRVARIFGGKDDNKWTALYQVHSSDAKAGALEDGNIDALRVYSGTMKGATIARPMLIAHEAQEHVPYAVTGEKDAVNDNGDPVYQTMDHQILVPLLIAEIQSLRARVATLEG